MKKLEYRAYNPLTKVMFNVLEIKWNSSGEVESLLGTSDDGVCTWHVKDGFPIHLMRKLNIKDREDLNLIELYEGDVVEITERYDGIWHEKEIGFIKEDKKSFEMYVSDFEYKYICSLFDFIHNYFGKILGNIYERKIVKVNSKDIDPEIVEMVNKDFKNLLL